MVKYSFGFFFFLFLNASNSTSEVPDCSGVDRWPAMSAYAQLKNAGLISPDSIDFKKNSASRIASEKIGKKLYRQVHFVTFKKYSGDSINVITVNSASVKECSMGDVQVFLVNKIEVNKSQEPQLIQKLGP